MSPGTLATRTGLLVAFLACAAVPCTRAQSNPLPAGARVRIFAPEVSFDLVTGVVVRRIDDTLVIHSEGTGDIRIVPVASIRHAEVYRSRTAASIGWKVGVAVGTAVTAVLMRTWYRGYPAEATALYWGMITGPAMLAGALIGQTIRLDRWESISLRPAVRAPTGWGRGFTFGFSVRF